VKPLCNLTVIEAARALETAEITAEQLVRASPNANPM
jgi:hypothetical protein